MKTKEEIRKEINELLDLLATTPGDDVTEKAQEKPWPQQGDKYFMINNYGDVQSVVEYLKELTRE